MLLIVCITFLLVSGHCILNFPTNVKILAPAESIVHQSAARLPYSKKKETAGINSSHINVLDIMLKNREVDYRNDLNTSLKRTKRRLISDDRRNETSFEISNFSTSQSSRKTYNISIYNALENKSDYVEAENILVRNSNTSRNMAAEDFNDLRDSNDGYSEDTYTIAANDMKYEYDAFHFSFFTTDDVMIPIESDRSVLESFNRNMNHRFPQVATTANNAIKDAEIPDSWYANLTERFKCKVYQKEELSISCKNVSLYELAKFLPNDTVRLSVSNSPTAAVLKPLFPNLGRLKYLRLCNNQHRYITRGFKGLKNLEHLDLSNNKIQVIKYAFANLTNLKTLNLTNNNIINIRHFAIALSNLKFFENLTLNYNSKIKQIVKDDLRPLKSCNLVKLLLFNTTLMKVEKGAFEHLPYLKVLEVSLNLLNEEAFENITSDLANTSIQNLHMRKFIPLNKLPVASLKFLNNTPIYFIDFSYNYFLNIPKFPQITSLRFLWLTHCSIKFIAPEAFSELLGLEELNLSGNDLGHYFYNSSLRHLKVLALNDQISRKNVLQFQLPDFDVLNMVDLEVLDLSKNTFGQFIYRNMFRNLDNLKYLGLSIIEIIHIEDFAFQSLHSLKILDLRRNDLEYLSNFTFAGLVNLTNLLLSGNQLIFLKTQYPFHSTPSLMSILLNYNNIDIIPENLFACTPHLELINLARNKIVPWTKRIFFTNSTIFALSLSHNQIDYITPVMLSELHQVKSYLDINKNPLNCNKCGTAEFQNFLKTSNLALGFPIERLQNNYTHTEFSLSCVAPKTLQNQSFLEAEIPFVDCSEPIYAILKLSSIVLISFGGLFFAVTTYFFYFFRWYVRYWIFHVKSRVKEKSDSGRISEKQYKYDAFVSYNSNDTNWIVSHLIHALEKQDPKFNLCIHERDFQVGLLITENILEAIENSKKVILVLTEEFVKSEWCMFELHMAQHRLFDEIRDCLVLIKLKKVNKKLYSKNLSYLEKTRMCLPWPDDSTGQKLFWDKIRKVLGYSRFSKESSINRETI